MDKELYYPGVFPEIMEDIVNFLKVLVDGQWNFFPELYQS